MMEKQFHAHIAVEEHDIVIKVDLEYGFKLDYLVKQLPSKYEDLSSNGQNLVNLSAIMHICNFRILLLDRKELKEIDARGSWDSCLIFAMENKKMILFQSR